MIRTLLAALAVLSLLACAAVLVVKWRSLHGHEVEFSLGRPEATQTFYRSDRGRVVVDVHKRVGGNIGTRLDVYGFGDVIAGTLMLPSLFAAVEIRRAIRRRMRRGLPEPLPRLPAEPVAPRRRRR